MTLKKPEKTILALYEQKMLKQMESTPLSPQEQLNTDAQNYALPKSCSPIDWYYIADNFKAGALSPSAANGCNKHVEVKVLQAQIDVYANLLSKSNNHFSDTCKYMIKKVDDLNQQLETLKQQP